MRIQRAFIVLASILLASSASWAADFVLIVSKANTVSRLSADEARNIFLGKKTTWPDGKSIVFVIQEGTEVNNEFMSEVLQKTPNQYILFWKKAVYTGTGTAPQSFKSDAEVKEFVVSNIYAIGYISEKSLDGTVKKVEIGK